MSQRIIGGWLAELFDTVITVNPHLHRIGRLGDAVPAKRSIAVSAGPLLADFLQHRIGRAVLLGPDQESQQWVAQIAERAGMEYLIAEKQRVSDKDVHIKLPARNLSASPVIIIDDVAGTARTLAVAAEQLRGAGATEIHCCIVHPIFAGDAEAVLNHAGIGYVWSTDSIMHPSNSV
ncbi:MAG: phosphoribosyltransferase family protein, partial [Methylococcales bacterium]